MRSSWEQAAVPGLQRVFIKPRAKYEQIKNHLTWDSGKGTQGIGVGRDEKTGGVAGGNPLGSNAQLPHQAAGTPAWNELKEGEKVHGTATRVWKRKYAPTIGHSEE